MSRGAIADGAGLSPPTAIDWNQYVVYIDGSIERVGKRSLTIWSYSDGSMPDAGGSASAGARAHDRSTRERGSAVP